MNKDDIILMARKAGITMSVKLNRNFETESTLTIEQFCFANLVAEREREACAKLCEAQGEYGDEQYAAAIRARGQA